MNTIAIVFLLSLVVVPYSFGHKITKRLLEDPKDSQGDQKDMPNKRNLVVVQESKLPVNKSSLDQVFSTTTPEILVRPFVEATDVKMWNESDVKAVSKTKTQNIETQQIRKGLLSIINPLVKPLSIVKEDCQCFTICKPNSKKNSTTFANDTTSILSEVESEIGLLFDIENGILSKLNEPRQPEQNENISITNSATILQKTNSDIADKVKNEEIPIFEDFLPFFPLETFLNGIMPHETIIIEAESEVIDPTKLISKNAKEATQNQEDKLKIPKESNQKF